jgi:Cu-Zn family superoxide dismutase
MKISILKAFALVLSISAVMVFAYPDHPAFIKELGDDEVLYGVAILYPDGGSGVSGNVKLRQQGTTTNIKATVYGLPVGDHGIHIHEFGNLLQGCTTAGSHYNPYNK